MRNYWTIYDDDSKDYESEREQQMGDFGDLSFDLSEFISHIREIGVNDSPWRQSFIDQLEKYERLSAEPEKKEHFDDDLFEVK